MKALYDYIPSTDSPNDNVEEELPIREGDILVVYGRKDEDGFYQVRGEWRDDSSVTNSSPSLPPSLSTLLRPS